MRSLPPGFGRWAAEAPQDVPLRIATDGRDLVSVAVPVGPGGLPQAVRVRVDAIQPGGETVFQGREWGPRGQGFRIDKYYRDEGVEHYRSLLVTAEGDVLERSHSIAVADAPQALLLSALQEGRRDVTRIDVVSGPAHEESYRVWTIDRIGREHVVECDLDGELQRVSRRLTTHLVHRTK